MHSAYPLSSSSEAPGQVTCEGAGLEFQKLITYYGVSHIPCPGESIRVISADRSRIKGLPLITYTNSLFLIKKPPKFAYLRMYNYLLD